ncbi:hypothetical protein RIF29_08319 [Crotalaria pallida]|uniref:Cation/H+ exchanger domain-containing protein n=1 Tax=Crotalaria pallida TaxID=3830 RepID=A0AAN9FX84_CROPI
MKSFIPIFELQVLVIYAITLICQFILKHLNVPVFVSQMLTGLILCSLLQQEKENKYRTVLFPLGCHRILETIGSIGYAFFMFLTGVEMDLSMIRRTGVKPLIIALIGFFTSPTICLQRLKFKRDNDYIILVLSQTSLSTPVVASLLKELQITNSELGRLALSTVLVSEVMVTILGSVSYTVMINGDGFSIGLNILYLIAFCIFNKLVCRPMMFQIIKNTPVGRTVKEGYIYLIMSMVLVSGWVANEMKQNFTLGAFVFGLAVPEGSPLGSALVKKLNFLCTCLLLPIYVTCSVMDTNLSLQYPLVPSLEIICYIIVVFHLIKIIACIIPNLYWKMTFKDVLALAIILNAKGIVEIGMYNGLQETMVLGDTTYGIMMLSIMIIACTVKWSVKFLYDPSRKYACYQKRNIMSLTPYSKLRMVACVHKQSHIFGVKDVLELCCPTLEQPIIVDAMHLIELVGISNPIFIFHNLQRTTLGSQTHKSYSNQVILAFDLYEQENPGTVTTQTYTAITPPSLMHEDVCHLAFDKDASIIILQFHQIWSANGGIEFDDKNIRSLNCKVLQTAPCSIGILVSRGTFNNDSNIQLAMVFVGGKDDRAAFFLSKRATRNPRINLVVYHLVSMGHMPDMEDMIDNEALADIKKEHSTLRNISYRKIITNDGPNTSYFLRDIVKVHDIFIVGRRHGISSPQTNGLGDWSEFFELGVMGDLLASKDFESRASILVVQQQVKDE